MSDTQNLDVKSLSLSDMISSGNPCWLTTFLMKAYANSVASLLSLYGTKCPYLVVLHVTTQIESYTTCVIGSLEAGSLTIKLNAIDF